MVRKELLDCNHSSNSVTVSLETLESVVSGVRCVNSFIRQYPDLEEWRAAYFIRARLLAMSVAVVRALKTEKREVSDPVLAQRWLIDLERVAAIEKDVKSLYLSALREMTELMHLSIFRTLESRGLVMGDPQQALIESNVARRQAGVFEWLVERKQENNRFIVGRMLTETTPMFLVEGFGLVSAVMFLGKVSDDSDLVLESECSVRLAIAGAQWNTPCQEFAGGNDADEIVDAASLRVMSAVTQKSGGIPQTPTR